MKINISLSLSPAHSQPSCVSFAHAYYRHSLHNVVKRQRYDCNLIYGFAVDCGTHSSGNRLHTITQFSLCYKFEATIFTQKNKIFSSTNYILFFFSIIFTDSAETNAVSRRNLICEMTDQFVKISGIFFARRWIESAWKWAWAHMESGKRLIVYKSD